MKISYDPKVDALSITFRETTVTTKHLAEGIAADYDSEGRLTGIEILDAQKRFGGTETMRRVELGASAPELVTGHMSLVTSHFSHEMNSKRPTEWSDWGERHVRSCREGSGRALREAAEIQ